MARFLGALLAALIALSPLAVPAQEVAPPEEVVPDPFGRDTPRGAVDGLLAAFASGEPEAAMPYLDMSDVPGEPSRFRARRYADLLERALDSSGTLLPGFRIAAQPGGTTGDGLEADLDRFAILKTPEGPVDLTLRRSEVDGRQVWRVSPEALELAANMAPSGRAVFEQAMPSFLTETRIGGASLAAWIAVLALLAGSLVLSAATVMALLWVAGRLVPALRGRRARRHIRKARLPVALILAALLFQAAIGPAGIPVVARATVQPVVEVGAWIALAWLLLRTINASFDEAMERMTRRERLGAVSVVSMLRRIVLAFVLIAASFLVAGSLGLDLTGWLAAFGLGGLAIALGAQKTIEHMVGGLSLIADQPIRVGDFCAVDGHLGTVEDIGLRSTRLRTLSNTLVTIPNGDLSSARIENYAGRESFHWHVTLGLRYETSPSQMRAVLWRLDQLMAGDERIAEGHRARFIAFGASSLDVEIFAYLKAPTMPEALLVREEMNLAVMEIVAECGTGFAFPSTTVYLAKDVLPGQSDHTEQPAPT